MLKLEDTEALPVLPYYTPHIPVSKKATDLGLDSNNYVIASSRDLGINTNQQKSARNLNKLNRRSSAR